MGITRSSVVHTPIDEVFAWHGRQGAIHRLLPPWRSIRVVAETDSLAHGRAVLRLPGGVPWIAQHESFDPPNQFTDRLVSLPLRWRHVHRFAPEGPGATRVTDVVETPVPAPLLAQTFRYRHRQLADDLTVQRAMADYAPGPLTVAMTGSSGLVGSALASLLSTGGHRVVHLVRRRALGDSEREWRPGSPAPRLLEGVDAVVHLAGASIAGRFSPSHKETIRESRIEPTDRLAQLMAATPDGPRVLVAASAIGYYGADCGDRWLDEESPAGDDFLARVVVDWEAATIAAADAGVRVVRVRTGIVQSPRGGVLRLLRPIFRAGLGGPMGRGEQWTAWIDLDDLTDIYYRAVVDSRMAGPINAVAPEPVRNGTYSSTLGSVLRRPSLLPTPGLGPRLLLGEEGAEQLAFASQRVRPGALEASGHRFRRPSLEASLRHQLGRMPD